METLQRSLDEEVLQVGDGLTINRDRLLSSPKVTDEAIDGMLVTLVSAPGEERWGIKSHRPRRG